MTRTSTPDTLAAQMAARQIERDLNALAVDATRFAEDAQRFAAGLIRRTPVAGEASSLAQSALQLAIQAARLDALRDTAAYLTASAVSSVAGQDGGEA